MNTLPTRRTVLAGTAAAGLLGLLPANLLARPRGAGHRTVIFLHLRGGNDGLNTVVPRGERAYARMRPTLAVLDPLALAGDDVGLHPALAPLHALYERGRVAIVQGVGWPRPELSHFRMTEIWQAGREDPRDGWVGRMLDGEEGHDLATLALDREPPLLFHAAAGRTLTFRDPRSLALPRDLRALRLLYRAESLRGGIPGEVARRGAAALETAARLASVEAVDLGRKDALASSLGLALALVETIPGLRALHVAHDGYDTHAHQVGSHAARLTELGAGLDAASRHLHRRGLGRRVLLVVWSEFGRRAQENASAGTDHGTAGPVFFVGEGLRGGLHGRAPSLENLRDGNLVPTTDLRRIAAEILARAWGQDPEPIVGAHAPLEIL